MAEPEIAIRAENITKTYGAVQAVKRLSFSVERATCFGLLGPNGAGKTTMMKMIYGKSQRDPQNKCCLSVFGYDPRDDELAIKYLSGVVPQEDNLDEELNVEQNLRIFSRFYDLPRNAMRQRIEELLAFMELSEKHRSKIKALSGGMKRRLVIARALLNRPKLLILDEPTTGLDPQVRHLIWDRIRSLKKQGMTILLTTHYMEEAFQICDTVMIMDKGERVIQGHPHALVSENIEEYVLEVSGGGVEQVTGHEAASSTRIDRSAEGVRLYANDVTVLRSIASNLTPGDYVLRQSNLEDLFLKTTGRQLHAKQ